MNLFFIAAEPNSPLSSVLSHSDNRRLSEMSAVSFKVKYGGTIK